VRPGPPPIGTRSQLSALVLKSAQVGPGFAGGVVPGGRTVAGQVTLNLCDQTFASERLRTDRLQVEYLHSGPDLLVSNELIGYRPGGTRTAMSEIALVASRCPSRPQPPTVANKPTLRYRLQRLQIAGLLPGYVAVRIQVSEIFHGKPRITYVLFSIYQARGRVLSAVYARSPDVSLAEKAAEGAAVQSARNLTAG
jgi:hypothetical protein